MSDDNRNLPVPDAGSGLAAPRNLRSRFLQEGLKRVVSPQQSEFDRIGLRTVWETNLAFNESGVHALLMEDDNFFLYFVSNSSSYNELCYRIVSHRDGEVIEEGSISVPVVAPTQDPWIVESCFMSYLGDGIGYLTWTLRKVEEIPSSDRLRFSDFIVDINAKTIRPIKKLELLHGRHYSDTLLMDEQHDKILIYSKENPEPVLVYSWPEWYQVAWSFEVATGYFIHWTGRFGGTPKTLQVLDTKTGDVVLRQTYLWQISDQGRYVYLCKERDSTIYWLRQQDGLSKISITPESVHVTHIDLPRDPLLDDPTVFHTILSEGEKLVLLGDSHLYFVSHAGGQARGTRAELPESLSIKVAVSQESQTIVFASTKYPDENWRDCQRFIVDNNTGAIQSVRKVQNQHVLEFLTHGDGSAELYKGSTTMVLPDAEIWDVLNLLDLQNDRFRVLLDYEEHSIIWHSEPFYPQVDKQVVHHWLISDFYRGPLRLVELTEV